MYGIKWYPFPNINTWTFGMEFHPTLCWVGDYLSLLELNLFHFIEKVLGFYGRTSSFPERKVHGANTLTSCHKFPAGSRQAARGARICETSLNKYVVLPALKSRNGNMMIMRWMACAEYPIQYIHIVPFLGPFFVDIQCGSVMTRSIFTRTLKKDRASYGVVFC